MRLVISPRISAPREKQCRHSSEAIKQLRESKLNMNEVQNEASLCKVIYKIVLISRGQAMKNVSRLEMAQMGVAIDLKKATDNFRRRQHRKND